MELCWLEKYFTDCVEFTQHGNSRQLLFIEIIQKSETYKNALRFLPVVQNNNELILVKPLQSNANFPKEYQSYVIQWNVQN